MSDLAMVDKPRRGVALTPLEPRRDVIVRAARLADELGYEVFSLAEGWGLDSSVLLTEIAVSTHRIRLAAGVWSIWGRTPATIAMAAATLDDLSDGRFILGLGASTPQLVQGFHALPYTRPAERLESTVRAVRALLAGEPVPSAGGRSIRLGQRPRPDLPIWIGASGERTMRIAGDLADGWFPLYLSRERCRDLAQELTDRRPADRPFTVAAGAFTVVDDHPTVARNVAAACTARYLTAMGEVYPRVVAAQGFDDEVRLVRAVNTGRAARQAVIPVEAEALLTEFTVHGQPADVQEQLAKWDDLVDITMIALPPDQPWTRIEQTLRAAAP